MTNEDRARYGRAAMQAGSADFRHNDARTNAVDTIANILHALRVDGNLPSWEEEPIKATGACAEITSSALRHFVDEVEAR